MSQTRVLIVDDSALVRQMLGQMLASDPAITVVGAAPDPLIAREMIKSLNPDVITLDIEMPRMDGLAFLEKIMTLRPMPVVMISSLTQKGADTALRALAIGAVDYIAKPTIGLVDGFQSLRDEIVSKVKAAAKAQVRALSGNAPTTARPLPGGGYSSSERVIAIGASTGGVEALQTLLTAFPADAPAILITQHMPALFTASFANRLDNFCAVTVRQAQDKERVLPGHVYIAPGGLHLELVRSGANYVCRVHDQAPVSGHRPSVDVLFRSVARAAGSNSVGIILTGMGKDGAAELKRMKERGAMTIAQDRDSSIVHGMPGEAIRLGAASQVLATDQIAGALIAQIGRAAIGGVEP